MDTTNCNWYLDKNHAGRVVLRGEHPNGSVCSVLELNSDGITVYGEPESCVGPTSILRDVHGDEWVGPTVRFDGTSLDTDCLVDVRSH